MKKKLFYQSISLLSILFLAVRVVHAADPSAPSYVNYCFPVEVPGHCWSVMEMMDSKTKSFGNNIVIGALKGVAYLAWLLDRVAAFVFTKSVTDNSWLLNIRTEMLNGFRQIMPAILRDTAFGGGSLMYVALSLAGLLMMIPLWGMGARFVRPEKVMVWGALLSLLFIGGSFGYDFIGMVENFRQGLVTGIIQNGGGTLPLDRLLLQPMKAGGGDLGFDQAMTLPPVFDSAYFPAAELTEVTISAGSGIGFGLGNTNVETPEERQKRFLLAGWGAFYAAISVLGAWLLVVVGIAYLILAFTALVLILFLFAALPLGFFEFGGVLLSSIMQRYFQIVMQSLALAIFMRWLSNGLGFIVDVNTPTNALLWGVVVVIMSIVASTFANGSIKLMLESGQSFQAVGATFGGPSMTQRVIGGAGKALGAVATVVTAGAAITGNAPTAFAASQVANVFNAAGNRASAANNNQTAFTGRPDSEAASAMGNVFVDNGSGEVA